MHRHPTQNSSSKPFLKWAGGKQRLLPQLLPLLQHRDRLIEPFVGAGSVFLGLDTASYVINDANSDLVAVWTALQVRPTEFVRRSAALFNLEHHSRAAYECVRLEFNQSTDRFERAVRFIYLNRFGFNGLFRVNSGGGFNVPYGHPQSLPLFPYERVDAAQAKLERCTILNGGFSYALDLATAGDLVYCDPPYLPSTNGKSFAGYTARAFDYQGHVALLERSIAAASRGATVYISNHDTPETRALYKNCQCIELEVGRTVGSAKTRRMAQELLVAVR
jgi:DNA adenine methylase